MHTPKGKARSARNRYNGGQRGRMPSMKESLSGHIGEFLDRVAAYLDQQDGLKNIQAGIV